MYCPKCGTPNKEEARFCQTCGQALNANPAPAAPPMAPVYPTYPSTPAPKPKLPGKGVGIASMSVGISSLVLFCLWYLAFPASIVGLALGCVATKKAKEVGAKNGMATAGIVCSAIALGLFCLIITIVLVAGLEFADIYGDIYGGYYY